MFKTRLEHLVSESFFSIKIELFLKEYILGGTIEVHVKCFFPEFQPLNSESWIVR